MLIAPGLLPSGGPVADSRAVSLAVAEPAAEYLTRKIESLRTFDWVLAENPEVLAVERAGFEEIDYRQWRSVSLRMTKSDGDLLEIELARPIEWVDSHQVAAGATIHLDLPEMGAVGPAEVVLVGPASDPGPRPSARCRLVTGTFRHVSGEVLDVAVDGLAEPIGTTAAHPFWSQTRQAFVPAGELRPGETLRTASGALCDVLSITPRPAAEPVYNLEVDGEHVYYVSAAGVLVHNSCYDVGPYDELRGTAVGLDAHHAGQKALMKKLIPGYDPATAPTILVPKVGHTVRGIRGIVPRSMESFKNARDVLARDIKGLRRVYPGISIDRLKELIEMNKNLYPSAFEK